MHIKEHVQVRYNVNSLPEQDRYQHKIPFTVHGYLHNKNITRNVTGNIYGMLHEIRKNLQYLRIVSYHYIKIKTPGRNK